MKYKPTGVKKPLMMPEEYKDWTIEELRDTLKPAHHAFANEYLSNGGNKSAAYRDSIWIKKPGNKERAKEIGSENVIKTVCGSAHSYLGNPLVLAYILKTQAIRKAKIEEDAQFSYENWLKRMDTLSKEAQQESQYSPAIRGHELIGKAAGHIDSNRQDAASRVPDGDLIGSLVGVLGVTAETLQSALNGGQNRDIIDIKPGGEMGTGPTIGHDVDVSSTNDCA